MKLPRKTVITTAWLLVPAVIGTVAAVFVSRNDLDRRVKPATVEAIDARTLLASSHRKGPASAAYTLVEFGDYECPVCRTIEPWVEAELREHAGLGFAFRHLPLDVIHANATALAQRALGAPNDDEYWRRHLEQMRSRRIFATKESVYARLTPGERRSGTDRLNEEIAVGRRLGLHATPTFFLCTPEGKVWRLGALSQVDGLIAARHS